MHRRARDHIDGNLNPHLYRRLARLDDEGPQFVVQSGETAGPDQGPDTLQLGFDRVGLDNRGDRGLAFGLRRVVAGWLAGAVRGHRLINRGLSVDRGQSDLAMA